MSLSFLMLPIPCANNGPAAHATEIPFVFETVCARYDKALTDSDEKMAGNVNSHWIKFAKNSNTNGAGLQNWLPYKADSGQLKNFTNDGPKAMADPLKARLDVAESKAK